MPLLSGAKEVDGRSQQLADNRVFSKQNLLAQVPPSEEPVEKISPTLFLIGKRLPISSCVTEIALQFVDLMGAIFRMRNPCEGIKIGDGI